MQVVRLRNALLGAAGMMEYGQWTEQRVAALEKAIAEGKSASEAGRIIGCTRNAAIGKAHRLGLRFGLSKPGPPRAYKPKPPAPVKTYGFGAGIKWGAGPAKPVEPTPEKPVPKVAASNPKPWTERASDECCWPVGGDGADTLSCCAPATIQPAFGVFYCDFHFRVRNVVRPTRAKRKAA